MPDTLSDDQRSEALEGLDGWSYDAAANAIGKDFRFEDFGAAFAFMTRVALIAEKSGHHPDWSNVYNRVSIRLSTHDAGGVTDKDIGLATRIDALDPQVSA
ncbi:4a-hydroxytetrahydrobiopterin dehydratase [Devosia enhydra]|uniref:Putative pterin-4-alpha-carbinolamine dehydratase n=1 Tax=Devosia enhydra TaxID=665118 RepID=A0A1K2I3B3_9HYPH|nr:4a-hydroxytetrahydrobiopterin dehydratase [Devosia enhydra]SFZ86833.1 4a-hydroxytetrahydrobiopterin dehydratase [Devosia enhydra]